MDECESPPVAATFANQQRASTLVVGTRTATLPPPRWRWVEFSGKPRADAPRCTAASASEVAARRNILSVGRVANGDMLRCACR